METNKIQQTWMFCNTRLLHCRLYCFEVSFAYIFDGQWKTAFTVLRVVIRLISTPLRTALKHGLNFL